MPDKQKRLPASTSTNLRWRFRAPYCGPLKERIRAHKASRSVW
jgi:hypothetical protein